MHGRNVLARFNRRPAPRGAYPRPNVWADDAGSSRQGARRRAPLRDGRAPHPPCVLLHLPRSFLHGNNLTGGIPDTWAALGSFTVLKQLTLSDNPNLGGTLPAAWGNTSEALQVRCGCRAALLPPGDAAAARLTG